MSRRPVAVARWDELEDRAPAYALVANVDLVVVRVDDAASVLYGRCLHRGALLADGRVVGDDLVCGLHGWDFRLATGVSAYDPRERLERFDAWVDDGQVWVDEAQVAAWEREHPQPFDRGAYQGLYADTDHHVAEEPFVGDIQRLAREGLERTGAHGPTVAMGVPRDRLPSWDDLQVVTARLRRMPLLDDAPVATDVTIGPRAARPLHLEIPIFVSDMSFGALSEPAKIALARGAELAGTGICSGEGGMLEDERAENGRYFYELASGRFGFDLEKVRRCQAFHFKGGQGAKTGTGGHLPGSKVTTRIAEVRGLRPGEAAISPSRFPDWHDVADVRAFAEEVRAATGGIPIGYKLSAQHVEEDLDAALEVGVDYVILDGRGGGTGAAPALFRDHISVPTIPALARAREHLDARGADHVTLVATGGLRTAPDFVKALALGADAIAIANSALQAIGCLGMRACHTNNCPVGIATQQDHLVQRLHVQTSAERLARYLRASVALMQVMARACGHDALSGFEPRDLTTFDRRMADLTGVAYGGVRR